MSETTSKHKAGFVNLIGSPNVGKSTLMNQLVGERLSIITSKAQTTRHRIMGIVNEPDHQVVFSDLPGVLKPNYKLQEGMMAFVNTALLDADLVLFVTDVFEEEMNDEATFAKLVKSKHKKLLLINKIDQVSQEVLEEKVEMWAKKIPGVPILPISALNNSNTELIMKWILTNLPISPPFYDKDALTDKPERFFVSEIIREKILLNYKKEIPYSVEVVVETFQEFEDIINIQANIFVARESQKGIIIGHKGSALKKVGMEARKDIEAFFQKQVFLETYCKVSKDWRNKEGQLKRFGYLY